jgi:hypothetical protein
MQRLMDGVLVIQTKNLFGCANSCRRRWSLPHNGRRRAALKSFRGWTGWGRPQIHHSRPSAHARAARQIPRRNGRRWRAPAGRRREPLRRRAPMGGRGRVGGEALSASGVHLTGRAPAAMLTSQNL